ncbi:MAG: hypothetical protein KC486_11655 [Myxococcales bacterium]|nr:hypothetical protein [Myxococcales bacterium]
MASHETNRHDDLLSALTRRSRVLRALAAGLFLCSLAGRASAAAAAGDVDTAASEATLESRDGEGVEAVEVALTEDASEPFEAMRPECMLEYIHCISGDYYNCWENYLACEEM